MPDRIRYHLDEHMEGALAKALHRRGIDVTTTAEVNLLAAEDPIRIGHALSQGRVLITRDPDFLRLHREGLHHAGIAFCLPRKRFFGHTVRTPILIWEVMSPEEMRDHIEFI
jgi:uncharacterized protein with PIN domain